MQTAEGFAPVFFDPRPLTNLLLIDELDSLSPVLDMQVFCCLVASVLPVSVLLPVYARDVTDQQTVTIYSFQGQGNVESCIDSCSCTSYSEADSATSWVFLAFA